MIIKDTGVQCYHRNHYHNHHHYNHRHHHHLHNHKDTHTHTPTHTLTHTERHTLTHWHKLSGKMQATFSIDERQIMSNSIELNFHWNNWIDWGNSCWPTSSVISPSNTRPNEQCHKRRMQKWLGMQMRRPGPVERDTGRRVLGERGRGLKVKVIKHLVLARTHGE